MFGSGPGLVVRPGAVPRRRPGALGHAGHARRRKWASTHLPVGSRIAVDIDNGPVINAIGHLDPVTAIGGLVNASPLFFDRAIGPYDIGLIRRADIRYILIDDRLAQSLPLYGTYVELGETHKPTRLTLAELNKWNSVPGARLIYDNGSIRIYDLASLLQLSPTASAPGPIDGSRGNRHRLAGTGRGRDHRRRVAPPAAARGGTAPSRRETGISTAARRHGRRRLRSLHDRPDRPAAACCRACRPRRAWPSGACGPCRATSVSSPPPGSGPQRSGDAGHPARARLRGTGARRRRSSVAVAAARRQWNPPAQLSVLYSHSGQAVATVALGSAGPVPCTLEVTVGGAGRVLAQAGPDHRHPKRRAPPNAASSSSRVRARSPAGTRCGLWTVNSPVHIALNRDKWVFSLSRAW